MAATCDPQNKLAPCVEKPRCLCGPLPHPDLLLREAIALFRVKQSEGIGESLYLLYQLPSTGHHQPPVAQGHPWLSCSQRFGVQGILR